MNYHNITKEDMLNGDGLRVVLWVAGCSHHCKGCQNPVTWDPNGGLKFDYDAADELFDALNKDYISGITFSGGDPLYHANRAEVLELAALIKTRYPTKTVWLYTGYGWEYCKNIPGIENIDILVDGPFLEMFANVNYPWAGSINQKVIDVKKSLETGKVVLHETYDSRLEDRNNEDYSRCDA